jgi:hypothetical protein
VHALAWRWSDKVETIELQDSMKQSLSWKANSSSTSPEISYIYGARRFITVFKTARHLSLAWVRSVQSTPSHPI